MATEEHGIFQFTNFGDDLFETEEKRVRHFIDKSYVPDETVLGKFVQIEEADNGFFSTKFGPQQLQNAMEWEYYKSDYRKCLDLCLKWIELNESCKKEKQFKMGEIYEIACRCSLKLKKLDLALHYAERILASNGKEPGVMFLVSQVFNQCSRYREAIELITKYLDYRRNDYLAYVELADIFDKMSNQYPEFQSWAYFALSLAIYFIERSPRPKTDFSAKHIQHELPKLKTRLSKFTAATTVDHTVLGSINLSKTACDYLTDKIYDNRTSIESDR
ncbi:hypothetical protein HDV06_005046 [Boothiomyces sp. JEL0866]|nr:hypothetical protein HDV06_005046 [Boothiomyces sp. JEL0866]